MDEMRIKQQRLAQIASQLRPLAEAEREAAYDAARNRVAGKPVELREYPPLKLPEPEPAEYPDWMIRIVIFLCLTVLIGAFVPSAYRIFVAGREVFCSAFSAFTETTPPVWLCDSVGATTVIMAEIGQTVALLAIAVLGTTASTSLAIQKATRISNTIFWTVAGMTTIVAYVGNLHVARPWENQGPFLGVDLFAWILDLFPPTLVIGIMYAMKELMLYFIRRRYQYLLQIETAKEERESWIESDREERKHYLGQPETHPQWLRYHSIAIKEALAAANGRQKGERITTKLVQDRLDLLNSLSPEEWKHLIKQQMLDGDYTVDPSKATAVEKFQERLEEIQQEKPEEVLVPKNITFQAEDLEVVKGNVWEATPGQWTYKSTLSGHIRTGIESKAEAERLLKQYEYHYNRRTNGVKA